MTSSSERRELERSDVLDSLGPSTCALHRRRLPGARVDLDHVLVAPTGVFTIEVHDTTARMDPQVGRLWIGSRRRDRYLDQARDQADAVHRVLADAGLTEVPVHPVLCFRSVQWPLLVAPDADQAVRVVDTRRLPELVHGDPVLTDELVWQVVDALDRHLVADPRDITPPTTAAPNPPADTGLNGTSGTDGDPDRCPTDPDTLVVTHWKQAGKQRLVVSRPDGTPLGFVDLRTQVVVPEDPRHRDLVREAASRHLQNS